MTRQVEVPNDGTWSPKIMDFNFSNGNLPKIFYFAVMDCEHSLHQKVKVMPKIEIEIDVT
jgi:hypothetical protein